MIIRVDTYEDMLNSIEQRLADSPYTVVDDSITDITSIGGGAYYFDVTGTGRWMFILKDSVGDVLGIRYASDQFPHGAGYPPWLSGTTEGSEIYTITITNSSGAGIEGARCHITSDIGGSEIVVANLTSNSQGKIYALLDPGTYYVWVTHDDYTSINPIQIEVVDE